VGDPAATLAAAVHALAALPGARVRGVSGLYVTAPVGVTDQPDFHNAVVALDVPAGPTPEVGATALLAALKGLERAFGRRNRRRWGPRELDLDLLLFGRARLSVERPPGAESDDPAKTGAPLVVPHPEARHRLFVLAPLAELAAGLVPPGWAERVATARDRQAVIEGAGAARRIGDWTGEAWSASDDAVGSVRGRASPAPSRAPGR
jgi:2-amino-4-hydroxy-6-hydroxymethyldihydropteridine diphosphokinase